MKERIGVILDSKEMQSKENRNDMSVVLVSGNAANILLEQTKTILNTMNIRNR